MSFATIYFRLINKSGSAIAYMATIPAKHAKRDEKKLLAW
jgi:hypothetical protein